MRRSISHNGGAVSWTPDAKVEEARPRRRRPASEGETLRRLTVTAAVAAIFLNTTLFFQTAISQLGPGDVTGAIVSLARAVFPEGGVQAPSQSPQSTPGVRPVVTTGGS